MKFKVLLLIDHELSARIMECIYKRINCQVEWANCEEMALEMARKNSYDLIMVDMYSKSNKRVETARKIRELQNTNKTAPIIGLYDYILSVDELREAQLLGMNACVIKPLVEETLTIILSEFVIEKNSLDNKIYYFTKDGGVVGFR